MLEQDIPIVMKCIRCKRKTEHRHDDEVWPMLPDAVHHYWKCQECDLFVLMPDKKMNRLMSRKSP